MSDLYVGTDSYGQQAVFLTVTGLDDLPILRRDDLKLGRPLGLTPAGLGEAVAAAHDRLWVVITGSMTERGDCVYCGMPIYKITAKSDPLRVEEFVGEWRHGTAENGSFGCNDGTRRQAALIEEEE